MAEGLSKQDRLWNVLPPSSEVSLNPSVDALLDSLLALFHDCKAARPNDDSYMGSFVKKFEPVVKELSSVRVQEEDFETIKVLGRGGFGEVRLVRYIPTARVYAMKLLKKSKMRTEREASFFREERDVMAGSNSEWITELHFAFQDLDYLFLVMEYIPGGDLLKLLYKEETLDETKTKFYIAECVLAIDTMHKLGYAHRDIKPDNLLIDRTGHLKLTDFGSCTRVGPDGTIRSDVAVGTPEYISPEVLQAQEGGTHGMECDWWALGIMMYEILYGEVPFYSEQLTSMYGMIMGHKKSLKFPDDVEVSADAKDFLKKLICDKEERMGKKGTEDIKSHKWFAGLDWANIRQTTPPFVPTVATDDDFSNFVDDASDDEDGPDPLKHTAAKSKETGFKGEELPFIGYSYNRSLRYGASKAEGAAAGERPTIERTTSSASLGNSRAENTKMKKLEKELSTLEKELEEAKSKVTEASGLKLKLKKMESLQEDADVSKAKIAKFEEQVKTLRTANESMTASMSNFESQLSHEQSLRKKIEEEKSQLETEKKMLEIEMNTVTSRSGADQEATRKFQEEIANLKGKLEREAKRANTLEEKNSELDKRRVSESDEAREAREKLSKKSQLLKSLEDTISELRTEVIQKTTAISELEASISSEKDQSNKNSSEVATLKKEVEQQSKLAGEAKALKKEKDELASQLVEKDAKIADLSSKAQKLEESSQGNAKDLKVKEAQFESLQNQVKSSQDEAASLAKAKEDLAKQLTKANEQVRKFAPMEIANNQLKKDIQELQGKISEGEAAVKKVESELAATTRAKNRIELEKDNTISQITAQLEEQLKLVESQKETLKAKDQQVQNLESTSKAVGDEAAAKQIQMADGLQTRIQSLETTLAQERKSIQLITKEKSDLTHQLGMVNLEVKELHTKLSDESQTSSKEIQKLQAKVTELQRESDEALAKLATLSTSSSDKDAEYQGLVQQAKDQSQNLKNTEARLSKLVIEKAEIEVQLEASKKELEGEKGKSAELQTRLKESQSKMSENKSLESDLAKQLEHLKEQVSDLEGQLKKAQEANETLKKSYKEGEARVTKEIQQRQKDIEEFEKEIEQIEEAQEKLQREYLAQRTINFELRKEIDELQEGDFGLLAEVESLKKKEAQLESELRDYETKMADMAKKVGMVEIERDKFKRAIELEEDLRRQSETKSHHQHRKLAELSAEKTSLEEKLEQFDEEMAGVQRKVESLAEENSQLKVSAEETEREKKELEAKIAEYELALEKSKVQLKQAMKAVTMNDDDSSSTSPRAYIKKIHKIEQDLASSKTLLQKREKELQEARVEFDSKIAALKKSHAELEKKAESHKMSLTGSIGISKGLTINPFAQPKASIPPSLNLKNELAGYLKIRHDKGARYGWNKKMYAIVKNYRFLLFEKPNEQENPEKAILNFNLKAFIFVPQGVDGSMIRETEADINSIFCVFSLDNQSPPINALAESSTDIQLPTPSSTNAPTIPKEHANLSIPVIEEKIKHLKEELAKEEKIKAGVSTMIKIVPAAQKKKVEEQLEGSNNMISSIKAQLASYEAALEHKQEALVASNQASNETKESKERKKFLKRELTTLRATRKTLEKQISSKDKGKSSKDDVSEQLEQVNQQISGMKVELETLEGTKKKEFDMFSTFSSSSALLDTISNRAASSSAASVAEEFDGTFFGHNFKLSKFTETKTCFHCLDHLHSYQGNEGFLCARCGLICHRNCHALLRFSCEEICQTNQLKPTYFLAQDSFDQRKWINGLREIRRSVTKSSIHEPGSPSSPNAPSIGK